MPLSRFSRTFRHTRWSAPTATAALLRDPTVTRTVAMLAAALDASRSNGRCGESLLASGCSSSGGVGGGAAFTAGVATTVESAAGAAGVAATAETAAGTAAESESAL